MRLRCTMLVPALLAVISCSQGTGSSVDVNDTYYIKGAELKMTAIPGGAFTMGVSQEGRKIKGSSSCRQVVLDGFSISPVPVSQALWKAVMGSNPSSVQNESAPVDNVSYTDCCKFVAKLSKLTGVAFELPSEAALEYAWKSGLVAENQNLEWTKDWWTASMPQTLIYNPESPEKVENSITVRSPKERAGLEEYRKAPGLSFSVMVNTAVPCNDEIVNTYVTQVVEPETSCKNETFEVGGVKFNMKAVPGGSFKMGATKEQRSYSEDEKPVRDVVVNDFEIGETEVTAGLWKAVMGYLPFGNQEKDKDWAVKPVVNVSWYDCQAFILKLREITGRKFRLPLEAEWEYAARGGRNSRSYIFAGYNAADIVAVYGKEGGSVAAVKSLRSNELGLYDMSGNAWEWCHDRYSKYGMPVGSSPEEAEVHVMRGGSASSARSKCRVSNRSKIPAWTVRDTFGFRLAL